MCSRSRKRWWWPAPVLAACITFAAACDREVRHFRQAPPSAEPAQVRASDVPAPDRRVIAARGDRGPDYGVNAYAMAEGKRLYAAFNCVGCHAHGGGGIGPPLMDEEWIYGSEPRDIFATIAEGTPNGMPPFGSRLTEQQAWQLVYYVRSMSGLARLDARPGRSDHMAVRRPENMPPAPPRATARPPAR